MAAEPFPLSPSLWHATALPAPSTPPLTQPAETDVAIVGAGYAGLSTALHLAQKGIHAVVLEAREPGWGGSGRNGGQVIPGVKYDPDELEAKFGRQAGATLADFMGRTADNVFGLIDQHRMEVPRVRNGWIQGAHSQTGLTAASSRAAQWQRRGVDAKLLSKGRDRRSPRQRGLYGGWLDPRGGAVQPLSYARELCRVAQAAGAIVHGETPVDKIERDGAGWKLTTRGGVAIKARKSRGVVPMATPRVDARYRAAPSSRRIRFRSATTPLSDNYANRSCPTGRSRPTRESLLLYFRLDHTGVVDGRPVPVPGTDRRPGWVGSSNA